MSVGATLSWPQRVTVAAALALMVLFYSWTALTSGWSARPTEDSPFYYALMAKSFLAGQLNLLIDPSPELLALPDPYDSVQNQRYRLHDAILFNGKYYLYYGPVPALVLFMPFRWLTGLDLPEPPVVVFFCSVALMYAFLLVRFLCRTYLPATPFWLLLAAVPALGFGSAYPFMLRRPIHYEIAVAAGQAFVFASLYYGVVGILGARLRRDYLALSGLLLGLAGGARFTMLGAGLIPVVLAAYVMIGRRREESLRQHLIAAMTFLAPVAACVFLLGLYNYLRFGSWTQFGLTYTLHGWISARTYQFTSVARLPAGLFYYLLAPPYVNGVFPFVRLAPRFFLKPPFPDYYLEPVAGLLPDAPFVAILLFAPAFFVAFRRSHAALCLFVAASMAVGLALLGLYSLWAGSMRYEIDFAMFLLIPSLLLWYAVLNTLGRTDRRRTLAGAAFALLLAVTVVFNTAFSITGYYDNLRTGSPHTYEAIHNFFRPLERLFGSTL
jgi:hypothetical protein